MNASAPGKLVLLGDYAVLAGHEALVAAVDRRARGTWSTSAPRPSPVVAAVLARMSAGCHPMAGAGIAVDTDAFFAPNGHKLGIGASAAVAAVAAGLVTGRADAATLALAVAAHRDSAGGVGSGIDVAASVLGGVIATRPQPAPVRHLPPRCGDLHLGVLFTGVSAKTSELVERCTASARWPAHAAELGALSAEGIAAWEAGDEDRLLGVVRAYGRAMAAMGSSAGVEVVTGSIAAIMHAADAHGAAAKPSGAGGGDVVLVLSRDEALFPRIAAETGALHVPMQVDLHGLEVEG